MDTNEILQKNNLSFKIIPIHLRELIFLADAPCDIYGMVKGTLQVVIEKGILINRESLDPILQLGLDQLLIRSEDFTILVKHNQKKLLESVRGLSLGDFTALAKKAIYHLSLNLDYLYHNPTDDESLLLQYQCAENFAKALLGKTKNIPVLYEYVAEQSFHYTISQPMLSSMMLLSLLKNTFQQNDSKIILLFITSYFKDIGMAVIPKATLDKIALTEQEKELIHQHQQASVEILIGRIQLTSNQLDIIKNHHRRSLIRGVAEAAEGEVPISKDHLLLEVTDILAAMTTKRPYRQGLPLFSGLQLIKDFMGVNHQQEFKNLVIFLQTFFKFQEGT